MARRIPQYTFHKPTGQARVRLNGRSYYLGQWNSPESRERYEALISRYLGNTMDVDRETVTIGRLAVEAHHVQEIASRAAGSLCTDNILLLCPNCHRRVHHDPTVVISTTESSIRVRTDGTILTIPKNTMSFLLERLLHHATQT